jgi:glutathione transport system substrate-binding protein
MVVSRERDGSPGRCPAFAAKDVVVAVGSNFTTLDPYDANDTLSQAVAKSFYQGLFGLDNEMKLKNVLAQGYTVSDDGLVYTIKLRSGVKFQDGTDFNAEAVKVNLDRASNPENSLKRYNLYKNIASTEAVDPTTVKITLKAPFSAFINILAHPATAMISPAALKKYGKEIGFHPVGTGPYELLTWNQTDFVKVKKFPGTGRKGCRSWTPSPGVRWWITIPAQQCCKRVRRSLLSPSRMSRPPFCRKTASWSWWPVRRSCSAISA